MDDHVDPLECGFDGLQVGDISLEELHAVYRPPVQGRQFIATQRLEVPPEQAAYEPAHSRYQDIFHGDKVTCT